MGEEKYLDKLDLMLNIYSIIKFTFIHLSKHFKRYSNNASLHFCYCLTLYRRVEMLSLLIVIAPRTSESYFLIVAALAIGGSVIASVSNCSGNIRTVIAYGSYRSEKMTRTITYNILK
jgi:hypothetical protein